MYISFEIFDNNNISFCKNPLILGWLLKSDINFQISVINRWFTNIWKKWKNIFILEIYVESISAKKRFAKKIMSQKECTIKYWQPLVHWIDGISLAVQFVDSCLHQQKLYLKWIKLKHVNVVFPYRTLFLRHMLH